MEADTAFVIAYSYPNTVRDLTRTVGLKCGDGDWYRTKYRGQWGSRWLLKSHLQSPEAMGKCQV